MKVTTTTTITIINCLATTSTMTAASTNSNTMITKLVVPANVKLEDALLLDLGDQQAPTIYGTASLLKPQGQEQEQPQYQSFTREVIGAMMDKGHTLLDNHMLEDAYRVFDEALFIMQQNDDANDYDNEDIAATLKAIARVRKAMGDYDGAFNALSEALELQTDHQSFADTLFEAGLVLMDGAYFDDALRVFKESITVQELAAASSYGHGEGSSSTSRIAEVYDYVGETFLRTNRLDDAINAWSDSAELWRGLNEDARLADSLNSMGVAYFRSGDYNVAATMYEQAISLYGKSGANDKLDVTRKNMDLVMDLASSHEECIAVYHVNGKVNQTGTIEC